MKKVLVLFSVLKYGYDSCFCTVYSCGCYFYILYSSETLKPSGVKDVVFYE